MTDCFIYGGDSAATPILLVNQENFKLAIDQFSAAQKNWMQQNEFKGKSGTLCALADANGNIERYVVGVEAFEDPFSVGNLPSKLASGVYAFEGIDVEKNLEALATGWGLGCYTFGRYKNTSPPEAKLKLPNASDHRRIHELVAATYKVRDLINTPAEDMMPQHLSKTLQELAEVYGGQFEEVVGDDLLAENYPCIHTVGRASVHAPRLLELRWGDNAKHPYVTLVGKGITFDSGGLDIKPAAGMRSMKKDMGGAAHVIGLAQLIMALELPVRLRVLVPAAENAISSNAFRPGDVIRTRNGTTVEIDNTDAEGRLVLCDALTEACSEGPDLLVDFATLTGAARVAVGTEIAAFFCNDQAIAAKVQTAGIDTFDPTWQLPLHKGYESLLKSHVADVQNAASTPFGGAITAALYLQRFVDDTVRWLHFDVMAWNTRARSGRPVGGEAMGVRAMLESIEQLYCH